MSNHSLKLRLASVKFLIDYEQSFEQKRSAHSLFLSLLHAWEVNLANFRIAALMPRSIGRIWGVNLSAPVCLGGECEGRHTCHFAVASLMKHPRKATLKNMEYITCCQSLLPFAVLSSPFGFFCCLALRISDSRWQFAVVWLKEHSPYSRTGCSNFR